MLVTVIKPYVYEYITIYPEDGGVNGIFNALIRFANALYPVVNNARGRGWGVSGAGLGRREWARNVLI
jgi:hypothetical protein